MHSLVDPFLCVRVHFNFQKYDRFIYIVCMCECVCVHAQCILDSHFGHTIFIASDIVFNPIRMRVNLVAAAAASVFVYCYPMAKLMYELAAFLCVCACACDIP